MKSEPVVWGEHALDKKKMTYWHTGELGVWMSLSTNEIRVASKGSMSSKTVKTPPEDLRWLRWTFDKTVPELTINPMLPDKPVVVKMETPFFLPPRSHTSIFIRVPIWIQVTVQSRKKKVVLLEKPVIQLSKTWFGSLNNGELCYWLSSSAGQEINSDANQPQLVVVACRLINQTADALRVDKICLQTAHLSIFEQDGLLLTDQIQVNYRGGNEISQAKATGKPPKEFSNATLISGPRLPGSKTLAARTFAPLRNLPGLGIPTDWN